MSDVPSRYQHLRIELSTIAYVMIAITIGLAAGRIAVVKSREGDTAFLSANDRSRWCTVASLVEDGTYAIDRQMAIKDSSGKRRPWSSIDRVRHTGPDGLMHDYSSKPPLFSTMVAGVYWLVYQVSQMSLTDQPIYVARIVLALVNLPLLLIMLGSIWRVVQGSRASDSAKLYAVAIACFGTALLPMAISLNNHLPAAMTTAVTLMLYLSVAGKTELREVASSYFLAGLAASATVANELPALAMLAVWTALFMRQHVVATIAVFLPAVAIVAIAFFISNQIAHQSFRPPYMHRSDGEILGALEIKSAPDGPSREQISDCIKTEADVRQNLGTEFSLLKTPSASRWILESADRNIRYALVQANAEKVQADAADATTVPADQGTLSTWQIRQWDHWYDYSGSYWTGKKPGVDAGEKNRLLYAFHLLLGHYGLFSLTPVWILVPMGLWLRIKELHGRNHMLLAAGIAAVSLVCLAFYISRPEIDRNYGGVSSSFRWLLWFMPLWVWAAIPAITWAMERDWARRVALVLFFATVFSMATALDNPWQHPWIYRYLSFLGWIEP